MNKAKVFVIILVSFLIGLKAKDSFKEMLLVGSNNIRNAEETNGIRELACSEVSQGDIDYIGGLTNLHKLEIVIHEEIDLSPLANLRNLEELSISMYGCFEEVNLDSFGELTQLKVLYIDEVDSDISFIKELEELEKLSIVKSEVDNLDFIKDLPKIEELQISYIGDTDIAALTKLTELKTLYLAGNNMHNFECLNTMESLECVYLLETDRSYEGRKTINLNVFEGLNRLSSLDIQNLVLINVESISQLPALETVILVNTEIDNIQCLAKLENLKRLEIYGYGNKQIINQISYIPQAERLVITDEIPDKFNN